jgi:hypothetical protein
MVKQPPSFHLHSAKPRRSRGAISGLIELFVPIQTYQIYRLSISGDTAMAYWCPICQSGTLFSSGGRDHVPTLRSIIDRDTAPPIGTIDTFRTRML